MECPICLNDWDSNSCVPLMLNCGHSFCRTCLSSLLGKQADNDQAADKEEGKVALQCPNCELRMSLVKPPDEQSPEACLNLLIKNYALISLVEAQRNTGMRETEQPEVKQMKYDKAKFKRDFQKGYIDSSGNKSESKLEEEKPEGEEDEKEYVVVGFEEGDPDKEEQQMAVIEEQRVFPPPPTVASGVKCSVHKNCLVHSYVVVQIKKSKLDKFQPTLLCTSCIYEKNLNANQIDIIPSVMQEIKGKIKSTKVLINYRKYQLQQSQQYFQRIQQGNRQIVHNKMKEHFQKLRNIMDEYEQKCEENLSGLLKKQEDKIKVIQDGIALENDHLLNDELNLQSLESHDDSEIVYMTNIIEDQHQKLASEYRPNIQFKNISIAIQLSESVYSKLDMLLNSKCKLMLDDLRQDGDSIKFMDVLERDKQWRCLSCETTYAKEIIFCLDCQQFRPLEMFKNLLHNPMKVSNFELNCIDQRRIKEKQLILDQDIKEDEEETDLDKMWFIVSGDWLFQWKCFISNKISSSSSIGKNKEIGILPPGPLNNSKLFLTDDNGECGCILREDLQLNKDYRGVNYEVWTLLKRIYGGNPQEIVRETLDLYSEDVYEKYIMLESERQFKQEQKKKAKLVLTRAKTLNIPQNNNADVNIQKTSSAVEQRVSNKLPFNIQASLNRRRGTNILIGQQETDQKLLQSNARSSSQQKSQQSNHISMALFQKSGQAGVGRNKMKRNDSMDSRYIAEKPKGSLQAPPTPVNMNKPNSGLNSNKRNLFDNNPNVPRDKKEIFSPKVPQDSQMKNMISLSNAHARQKSPFLNKQNPGDNRQANHENSDQQVKQNNVNNKRQGSSNNNLKESFMSILGMGGNNK